MMMAMPRWDPCAEDRLREAALELFLEHGYENVTVAQITERAGLTRRSFSRYFTDKRDVLFAGSERLPAVLARSVRHADSTLSSFEALLAALVDVAGVLADQAPLAAQRRAVVQASPELQERGRTKFAAVTDAVADALRDRGTAESEATLLAAGRCRHLPHRVRALDRPAGRRRPAGPHPGGGCRARLQPGRGGLRRAAPPVTR